MFAFVSYTYVHTHLVTFPIKTIEYVSFINKIIICISLSCAESESPISLADVYTSYDKISNVILSYLYYPTVCSLESYIYILLDSLQQYTRDKQKNQPAVSANAVSRTMQNCFFLDLNSRAVQVSHAYEVHVCR